VGAAAKGELESNISYIARALYEASGGRLRLAATWANPRVEYAPAPNDPLLSGEVALKAWIFSAQYNAEKWSLTGEYSIRDLSSSDFGPFRPDFDITGDSYYLQATYRPLDRWEAFLRYDAYYADWDDRDGTEFEASTGGRVPAHTRFAKDWTVGVRFDVTPSFMLRGEVHIVNGTGWLPPLDNPDRAEIEQRWNMLMFLASYRF
jgi:hypothetical protein